MAIAQQDYESLITAFDLGTSTAEKDPLLPAAQIRTQEFSDLYFHDRIDTVRGIKGAGKTALYRVFQLLQESFKDEGLFCIFGVEATGDPVFKNFRSQFQAFSDTDFELFWGLYFLTLIRDQIANDPKFLGKVPLSDRERLEEFWKKLDVPFEKQSKGLFSIVDAVMKRVHKVEGGVKVETAATGTSAFTPKLGVEFQEPPAERTPIYLGDVREALCEILRRQKIRIWLMIDRLDEVFPRRSIEEDHGLKGLLKTSYNLSSPELRVKVFLRDDIIDQLANSAGGFTALTHVMDRASATITWARDNILLLIAKRIVASPIIAQYFKIDAKQVDGDATYRERVFQEMFPAKIGKLSTLDWIMNVCSDGNDVVTPRDVIDLFNMAKSVAFKDFQLNKGPCDHLLSADNLKSGFELMSRDKYQKVLMAEFPHMKANILKLHGSRSIHNAQSLESCFGAGWQKVAADFVSIGLFEHDIKKAYYRIPKLWHKGLRITQGKAFRSRGEH